MASRSREFLDRVHTAVVVGDGAMGSRLYELGVPLGESYEALNLTRPDVVRRIHREYLDAGAQLIEANTFSANRLKLATVGLAGRVVEINAAAVRLAIEESAGRAFVAGAVGPLPAGGLDELTDDESRAAFAEQIVALAEAGADLILLETFAELHQIELALAEAKARCDLPIVAQMTFPDGRRAPDGSESAAALRALRAGGADVVGTNCGRGVAKVLRAVEHLAPRVDGPISAFANAGMPEQIGGRSLYLMTPDYFAEAGERMVRAGASLVGGCCGTRAADIAALAGRIATIAPPRRAVQVPADVSAELAASVGVARPMPDFLTRIREKTVVLVEIDPPRGTDMGRVIRSARALKEAGADAVTLGDSPLGTLRMDGMVVGSAIERELDLPVVCHLACRDRNLIGTQSLLLGAHALGIRSILAVTGDPAKLGDHPEASSVYNLNSVKLVQLIARLNGGHNQAGQPIGQPTAFCVGVAFNPNARNLEAEAARLRRKAEAGADFVMTQAVFDAETMRRGCAAARAAGVRIPIFAGVYPLISSRNAEFLHNEFPGITLADAVRQRMASAGPDRPAMAREGIAIARELIDAFRRCADGLYIIAPLNRPRAPVELIEYIRATEKRQT